MSLLERVLPQIRELALHRYLGLGEISAGGGRSRLDIVVGPGNRNPAGALHGGVLYLLCDVACYAALLSELADHEDAVTHDIHVAVLRAAAQGDRVTFTGQVIKRGRTLAFVEARACCADRLLARAAVTKSIVRGKPPGSSEC